MEKKSYLMVERDLLEDIFKFVELQLETLEKLKKELKKELKNRR